MVADNGGDRCRISWLHRFLHTSSFPRFSHFRDPPANQRSTPLPLPPPSIRFLRFSNFVGTFRWIPSRFTFAWSERVRVFYNLVERDLEFLSRKKISSEIKLSEKIGRNLVLVSQFNSFNFFNSRHISVSFYVFVILKMNGDLVYQTGVKLCSYLKSRLKFSIFSNTIIFINSISSYIFILVKCPEFLFFESTDAMIDNLYVRFNKLKRQK